MIKANLEGVAAYLAARNINEEEVRELRKVILRMNKLTMQGDFAGLTAVNHEFHLKVHTFSRSSYLLKLLGMIQPFWERWEGRILDGGEAKRIVTEHQGIFEALAYHHGELAEGRMRAHILGIRPGNE